MKKLITASIVMLCICIQCIRPAFALDQQITDDTIVEFGEEQIKQEIIDNGMDKNGDRELTVAEAGIMGMPLDLSGMSITSLKGLEYTSIRSLIITEGAYSDTTPLESLTDIIEVRIGNTNITAVPNFKAPEKINKLDLGGNKIGDISAVVGLINATSLILEDNQVTDISVLANLTRLNTLYLGNNNITDITPLNACTNIYALGINDNPISDITTVS